MHLVRLGLVLVFCTPRGLSLDLSQRLMTCKSAALLTGRLMESDHVGRWTEWNPAERISEALCLEIKKVLMEGTMKLQNESRDRKRASITCMLDMVSREDV